MFRALSRLATLPDKLAFAGLVRGMSGQIQLTCASALLRSGAMAGLGQPATLDELALATGASERDLLRSLLELGVARGLLKRRGERYAPRSAMARRLAADPEGPLASMLLEFTSYHHEVMVDLPGRLAGEPPRDYLDRYGPLVARSSRILDHWLRDWVERLFAGGAARKVLDLGCGSGTMLCHIGSLGPEFRGAGLELDPAVAEQAREQLASADLGDRFEVHVGDMRDSGSWPSGPFDVITANQNVYYFDAGERAALWRSVSERLGPGGRVAIATSTAGGPMSSYFDLVLGSTEGCRMLPGVEQLERELVEAGFAIDRRERLIPGDSVYGLAAVRGET
ncbi:hypothetical protein ABI59_21090 [Acidobacteria bacterium Mor1]|nr:hypothetical protein ABI59_21090 [Acidobacteria bacterium Mor1]